MKKKCLALLLSIVMLACLFVPPVGAASVTDMKDVSADAWYYPFVKEALEQEFFNGTSDTTFSPDKPMTRGMFVTVLANVTDFDEMDYGETKFLDVPGGKYYSIPVDWATENGIVTGTGNGKFSPNAEITREQAATILYNYAKYMEGDLTYSETALNDFTDAGSISSYAVIPMKWAVTQQILNGSGNKLTPKKNATRAQVAKIFCAADDVLYFPEPEVPEPGEDHVHPKQPAVNFEIRNGYACNYCYRDVTDYTDMYSCHGGYHTHTWWLTPAYYTCEECGKKVHTHRWKWNPASFEVGTDTFIHPSYYECLTCGANVAEPEMEYTRVDHWTTPFDFTGTDYIINSQSFPKHEDIWALQYLSFPTQQSVLAVGETLTIPVTYTPLSTTTDKTLQWTSSNPSVATVKNGVVTGLKSGKTVITATSVNQVKSSLELEIVGESHAISDFKVLLDGKNVTDGTVKVNKNQRYDLQFVPTGTDDPEYFLGINDYGTGYYYYEEKEFRGLFNLSNFNSGETLVEDIPDWDGKIDVAFIYSKNENREETVTYTMRDKEGNSVTHSITFQISYTS
jgi:hypothetical protein